MTPDPRQIALYMVLLQEAMTPRTMTLKQVKEYLQVKKIPQGLYRKAYLLDGKKDSDLRWNLDDIRQWEHERNVCRVMSA